MAILHLCTVSSVMFVRVRRLRRAGRRIPGEQAHAPEHQVIGDLESVGGGGEFVLQRHLSNDDATDVLIDARVVAILSGVGGMLLKGFECCTRPRCAGLIGEYMVLTVASRRCPTERVTAFFGVDSARDTTIYAP